MAEKFVPVRAVKKKLYYIFRTYGTPECIRRAIYKIFDKLPAADVAPVKYGHWVYTEYAIYGEYDFPRCSECGFEPKEEISPYCPNCGAKMDGGEGE